MTGFGHELLTERKERCQLQRHGSGCLVRVRRKAGTEPREGNGFLGEGSQKVRAGGDHTSNHTCRAHKAVQTPAPALTAGDREKGQQNDPSRNAKGSRRAKVDFFAFPIPEVTCVTYTPLPPMLLSGIKLICHDVSRSVLTSLTTCTHFLLRSPRALGWLHHLAHPCSSLTHRGSRISFTHLHVKGFRGNHLAEKWPLSMEGSESEKSVHLHLHRGSLGLWSDNSKWLVNSSHEEY